MFNSTHCSHHGHVMRTKQNNDTKSTEKVRHMELPVGRDVYQISALGSLVLPSDNEQSFIINH